MSCVKMWLQYVGDTYLMCNSREVDNEISLEVLNM